MANPVGPTLLSLDVATTMDGAASIQTLCAAVAVAAMIIVGRRVTPAIRQNTTIVARTAKQ